MASRRRRRLALAALLALLAPAAPRAPDGAAARAVVVLRGDSFRSGPTGTTGCDLSPQSVQNQLHQLRSVGRCLAAPLLAAFGAVAVTGLVYECAANDRIVEFFERWLTAGGDDGGGRNDSGGASDAATGAATGAAAGAGAAVAVRATPRGRADVSQRTLFRRALAEAARRHPRALFFLVTRLDITYGEASSVFFRLFAFARTSLRTSLLSVALPSSPRARRTFAL